MEKKEYSLTPEAGAYVEALKLLQEFEVKLYEAYDKAFGEWDGVISSSSYLMSRREREQTVVEHLLEPVREHFKQVFSEEVCDTVLKDYYSKKDRVCN